MPKKPDIYAGKSARELPLYSIPEAARIVRLIERARRGERSVITKRGKPYAEVVPVGSATNGKPRLSILSLAGTGRSSWGHDSKRTLRRLRDEWQ